MKHVPFGGDGGVHLGNSETGFQRSVSVHSSAPIILKRSLFFESWVGSGCEEFLARQLGVLDSTERRWLRWVGCLKTVRSPL